MSALAAESWTWYGLTWLVVIVRMMSRRLVVGSLKKLQIDDYIMLFAMLTDTVLIAAMNIISYTSSNLIDPAENVVLTPAEISEREFGSKMVLVVEQMQIHTIWAVKVCLLIMYNRLTLSLRQNVAVKILFGYVGLSYLVMQILYLGVWCRPFEQYWAVPPDNIQCSAATNHLITNVVFNISSDVFIILVPMPVFLQSRITWKKKLVLCAVFAVGCFTILSAILNKYYSFTDPFGADWTFWYIRESSTALIAANLPMTWTLFRKVFSLKSFNEKSSYGRSGSAGITNRLRAAYGRSTHASVLASRVGGRSNLDDADVKANRSGSGLTDDDETNIGMSRHGSQEQIVEIPLKIYQRQEVEVRSDSIIVTSNFPGGNPDRLDDGRGIHGHVGVTTRVTGGHHGARSNSETASGRSEAGIVKAASGV